MTPTAHRPRKPHRGDRGAAAVEVVIATPLLLLLIAVVIQLALWYHATNSADAVARQALATTRLADISATRANQEADAIAQQLAGPTLVDPAVVVDRQLTATTVTVTGTATQVLPFITLPIEVTASGPTERFQPAHEEPSP